MRQEVDPAGQKCPPQHGEVQAGVVCPGASPKRPAAQGPEQAEDVSPDSEPNTPGGHSVGEAAPSAQYDPAWAKHAGLVVADARSGWSEAAEEPAADDSSNGKGVAEVVTDDGADGITPAITTPRTSTPLIQALPEGPATHEAPDVDDVTT